MNINTKNGETLTNWTNNTIQLRPVKMPVQALAMFFGVVFLTSLLGNTAVILVVFRIKRMRTRMNYLLANLSMGSLAVTTLCMPFFSVEYLLTSKWIFQGGLCRGINALEITLTFGCIFTVLSISYDRYLGICHPMNTYTKWRATRIRHIILMIWVTSIALAFPMLFCVERIAIGTDADDTVSVCSLQTDSLPRELYLGSVSAIFMIVFVMITYLISRMAISLCSKKKRRPRVIAMLMSVATIFFFCLLPYRILVIIFIIFPYNSDHLIEFQTSLLLYELLRLATLLNFALNPFLYNFLSKKFNVAFKELIKGSKDPNTEDELPRTRTGNFLIRESILRFKLRKHEIRV